MSIKPVLVPDHDAADLRKLMDTFAEATTGPTRQQLAESRAAVAAARGVAEGIGNDQKVKTKIIEMMKDALDKEARIGRGDDKSSKIYFLAKEKFGQEFADSAYEYGALHVNMLVEPSDEDEMDERNAEMQELANKMGYKHINYSSDPGLDEGVAEGSFGDQAGREINHDAISKLSDKELQRAYKFSNTFNIDPEHAATAKALRAEIKKRKEQGVAEGSYKGTGGTFVDRIVGEIMNYRSLNNTNPKFANLSSAIKSKLKSLGEIKAKQIYQQALKQAAELSGKQGVSEGIMDTVKQTFNDCVVGYPMGTSDEQFIQGWARAIQAETGRDIPLEKLTQLYQDYVERSDELMQSHGTTNEESAESLAEFAPPDSGDGGGDDDGFDEDTLRKLAAQWFAGDEDPQVERLLAAAGWEIGQDEGYDNEPGVFVVLSGDADGRSYMSWPAEELRSDVAEARPDVEEGINEDLSPEIKKLNKTYKKLFSIIAYDKNGKKLMSGPKAHKEVSRQLGVDPDDMDEYLRLEYYDFFDTVNKEWDKQKGDGKKYYSNEIYGKVDEDPTKIKEAQPDVMRHKGDKTVRVVKKGGKPIGEIGIDAEASPGNGQYYVKLYDGSYDAVGFDTAEEALAELKYAISEGLAEQQVDELSPKTLGSYIKKSSADAAARQGEVSGRNQFGKGAEFAVKAFYGDRIQPNPTRTDPRIAKRQAGVDQAVDRLTAEDVAEGIDPVEQLRADIQRFAR